MAIDRGGLRYEIQVKRKGAGNRVRLEVDGKPVDGALIPLPADGTQNVQVVAWLGQLEELNE